MEVKFYETVDDRLLKFAVIASKYQGRWIFCKHRQRDTFEIPGGHREPNEDILTTARRELFEETGATDYSIMPICVYSVEENGAAPIHNKTFGKLFFADVHVLGPLPEFEIEKIKLFYDMPSELTYPQIQPTLMDKVKAIVG
ncbi:MAG: NUDIX domain-containing protein [Clostridiales bacterium]|nr:NUDIX domain-containing protein [Clostridiales bacterium]